MNVSAEHDEQESRGALPEPGPKMTVVSGLSLLTGILLTVIAGGGVLHYQRTAAVNAQLRTANEDLKQKRVALADMQAQLEALSEQLQFLRSYAPAHSGPPGERPAASAAPVAAVVPGEPPAPVAREEMPLAPPPPKVVKTRPQRVGDDCELVGKSPAEQARTLQRCVAAMDSPPAKSRSR